MEQRDRRTQRTEETIQSVFFEMLEEMPPYKITVSALCRRANINRGTFYLHYQDCYDLIEALSKKIASRFTPYVENILQDRSNLKDSIISILSILTEDPNVTRLIQSSDLCQQIIRRHFRSTIQTNWKRLSTLSDTQADLIYAYISGGVFAALPEIGSSGSLERIDELCETICRIVTGGLSAFVQ